MGVLEGKAPAKVWHYFEEICKIPHGSGNIDQISDYLVDFAKTRDLEYYQDETKNAIIKKPGTTGYEKKEPIILQGHMDMVAVKTPDSTIDMKTQGLRLEVKGDWLSAKETSLGGDDGIAVAFALALLDSTDIPHPPLEVLITVDEEVGMDGAKAVDLSVCKGKRMLNLDSEEEGIFLAGCAGGMRVDCLFPMQKEWVDKIPGKLLLGGLLGGHSGEEIHRERGNAIVLMGRVLTKLLEVESFQVASILGGLADNAIPRECTVECVIEEKDKETVQQIVAEYEKILQQEYAVADAGLCFSLEFVSTACRKEVYRKEDASTLANFIFAAPNGVQAYNPSLKGLPETSLNLGVISEEGESVKVRYSLRSSKESAKLALCDKVSILASAMGGRVEKSSSYPGWDYKEQSPLRELMVCTYEKMYGTSPKIQVIHAGLECGLLMEKIPDLDCVSIGPDMKNIHTTEEELSILSTERVWNFVLEVLKNA